MKIFAFLLLLAACFVLPPALSPVSAQDGCGCGDGCTSIESSDEDEEQLEEQRKKNAGLAGGGAKGDDDPNAPKVKMSLQQKINAALKTGVKWLKKRQGKDGSWGPVEANSVYGQPNVRGNFVRDEVGPTAFAVYTLAKCGVKKSDRSIKKGIEWLMNETLRAWDVKGGAAPVRNKTTHGHQSGNRSLTPYESAAIVMMIEAVHQRSAKLTGKQRKRKLYSKNALSPPSGSKIPKKQWRWMHDRMLHLTKGRTLKFKRGTSTIPGTQNGYARKGKGTRPGGWRYGPASGDQDLSATQIVLLALRAASQAGYPIDRVAPKTWEYATAFIKKVQQPSGGFSYQPGHKVTAGMTACGVGSLIICREQMTLQNVPVPGWVDGSIKKGLAHLDEIWTPARNAGGRHHYYHLYAVERVGDLTGRKEFNSLDWYVRGAQLLCGAQDVDGKWQDGSAFKPHDVLGTCYALLFLKRATPPTVTISGN